MSRRKNRERKTSNNKFAMPVDTISPKFKERILEPLKPKNQAQAAYINVIRNNVMALGTGFAGTGKSYIPAALAAEAFLDPNSNIDKIVIVRPNEGVGKSIGFLKGTSNDKMIPWCMPILDVLYQKIGKSAVEYHLNSSERIELLPLEYARGRSLENSFVILDEVQNIDWESLKCLMLRLGQDSKLVIDGDIQQCDIGESSGLKKLLWLMDTYHTPIGHVDFKLNDVVRSDTCKYLLEIFDEAGI